MLIVVLHLLAEISRWYLLRFIMRLIIIITLIITSIDLVVFSQFFTHISLHDFIRFSHEFSAIISFLPKTIFGQLSVLFVTITLLLIFSRYLQHDRIASPPPILIACLVIGIAGTNALKTPHVLFTSSIEAFFNPETRNFAYSDKFKATIPTKSTGQKFCYNGEGAHPDIILLVFESLSMYHSTLFSGINDWMPQFDNISENGRHLSNFYANGVDTEQGLIALFSGEPPISKGFEHSIGIFEQFYNLKQSVPKMLHEFGYRTVFLATSNLGFIGKGSWLRDIGFDYIEGHDAPYYSGMVRYIFNAASDDALYGRALLELQHKKTSPIFMALETTTTHPPFTDPISGTYSEELAFRYADQQLGIFVENLKSSGFFNNGYLMIVGDHRVMKHLTSAESARYGDLGYARVPFTVIGSGINGENELANFSQSDLLPSLRHWLGKGRQCVSSNQGIFLPTAIHQPTCSFTSRLYNRNNVYVHCGTEDYIINLNGDRTQYVGDNTGPTELLEEVNRLRIGAGF